jgi:leucyl-tRNA synthetase
MTRFLNAVWRNIAGDDEVATSTDPGAVRQASKVSEQEVPEALDRMMHRTIKKVGDDIAALRFNTAIAELIKLNNELTRLAVIPRDVAENLVLMLAPFAPHIGEELWARLGHTKSLARRPWPVYDQGKLTESTIQLPVQVNGKVRDRIEVPAEADEAAILAAAERAPGVQQWISGKQLKKKLYVPRKLVNLVVG